MKNKIQAQYFYGFDYLRTFFSLAVVSWHMHILGKSTKLGESDVFLYPLADWCYFHIFLLAVPIFVGMSIYLYLQGPSDIKYLLHRVKRLAAPLVFWTALYHAFVLPKDITSFFVSIKRVAIFFIHTGSIFYFFSLLIVLTIFSFFVRRCPLQNKLVIYGVFFVSIGWVYWWIHNFTWLNKLGFWSPSTFIPLVFGMVLIRHSGYKTFDRALLFCLWLICMLLETMYPTFFQWNNYHLKHILPCYARPSVYFAVPLLIELVVSYVSKPAPVVIQVTSQLALSLYCIHFIIIFLLMEHYPGLGVYNRFAVVVVSSWIIGYSLKKYNRYIL